MKKMPPIEKIPEAWSAIADGRVEMKEDSAIIYSSDRSKFYTVMWEDDTYSSNDNSSYWQGAIGYPILSVLMLKHLLPLNENIVNQFKGIEWKAINTAHKNKYAEALNAVLMDLAQKGAIEKDIRLEMADTFHALEKLPITTRRSPLKVAK